LGRFLIFSTHTYGGKKMGKAKVFNLRTGKEVGAELETENDLVGELSKLKALERLALFKVVPKKKKCVNPCPNCVQLSPCNRNNIYQVIETARQTSPGGPLSVRVELIRPMPICSMLGLREMCPNTRVQVVTVEEATHDGSI
jgi:hypothetical protein